MILRVISGEGKLKLVEAVPGKVVNNRVFVSLRDITDRKELGELYLFVIDNIDDVISIRDFNLNSIYVSPSIKKLLGYNVLEFMKLKLEDYMPPETLSKLKKIVRELREKLEKGEKIEPIRTEWELIRKDGKRIWVEASITAIQDKTGKHLFLGVLRGITQRKQLEEKLRRYERFYKEAQDLFFALSREGKFIEINPKFAQILERSLDELIGHTSRKIIHKDDLDRLRKFFNRTLSGEILRDEFRFVTKSGKIKWLEIVEWPVYKDGEVVEVEGVARDISNRKILEEKLQKEKKFIGEIIEAANSLIVGLDEEGKIILFNKKCEEVTGYKREEVLGKNWFEIFVPVDYRRMAIDAFEKTKKEKITCVYPVVSKNGVKTIAWSSTFVERNGRKIIVNIGVDITDLEIAKRRIEKLNEYLRIINKVMRHDILNDLTVIRGIIEISGEGELMKKVARRIDKMVEFIEKIRELETMAFENIRPIAVRDYIEKVAEKYNVELSVEGHCLALADDAFLSVVDNIIRNAIQHGRTCKIDIKIEDKNSFCEVRIADYGKGIPDEIKDKIFDEGFGYGEFKGSGLGLYVAKRIVESYGGEIYVESNVPSGCVFIIKLPKAKKSL